MSDYKQTRDAAGNVTSHYGQMLRNLDDDLVERARHNALADMPHYASVDLIEAMADRIEELEAKLAKKDGCLEETYRRWKNGADLRVLAKAEGCTQERMRHKMKRYEEDKVRLLEAKLINAMHEVATYSNDPHLVKWARKSLAELKGETDE